MLRPRSRGWPSSPASSSTVGAACAAEQRSRDVDADFLDLSQTLAGYYLMGPGFERIADALLPRGDRRQGRVAAAAAQRRAAPTPPRRRLDRRPRRRRPRHRRLYRRLPRGRTPPRLRRRRPRQAARRRQPRAGRRVRRPLAARSDPEPCSSRVTRPRRRHCPGSTICSTSTPKRAAKCAPRSSGARGARADERRPRSPRLHRAGHQRSAAALFADPFALARSARGGHARRLSHSGRRHDLRVPATRPTACPRSGRTRSGSIPSASRRTRSSAGRASHSFHSPPATATASERARRRSSSSWPWR